MKITNTRKLKRSRSSLATFPIEKCIYCIAVLLCLLIYSTQTSAQELSGKALTSAPGVLSIGAKKTDHLSTSMLLEKLKQTQRNNIEDNSSEIVMTRAQKIANKAAAKNQRSRSSRSYYYDFAIYSGASKLLDDDDGDGYYNTFGILFDADILSSDPAQEASVYAEVYLSQDGGPWLHLYTTEPFLIYADSAEDEYEVVTQLAENYFPDHYNVLIDLYESGYDGIVATYSSDDSDSLYALPLESLDWEYYQEDHHDHHGGSYSITWLIFLLLTSLIRHTPTRIKKVIRTK